MQIEISTQCFHSFAQAHQPQSLPARARIETAPVVLEAEKDFAAILQEATKQQGVDVILDMVGGPYINRNLQLLVFR